MTVCADYRSKPRGKTFRPSWIEQKQNIPARKIVIAGMKVPPNMGREYGAQFEAIYPALAKKNQAPLIPFVLEGVGGVRELNLPDGMHPTAKGHQIVAANLWKVLEPVLRSLSHG